MLSPLPVNWVFLLRANAAADDAVALGVNGGRGLGSLLFGWLVRIGVAGAAFASSGRVGLAFRFRQLAEEIGVA